MSLLGQFLEFTTTPELWFHKNMSRLKQVRYLMWAHKYNYYKHGTSYATSPPQAKFWGFPLCLHWIFFVLRAYFFPIKQNNHAPNSAPSTKAKLFWLIFLKSIFLKKCHFSKKCHFFGKIYKISSSGTRNKESISSGLSQDLKLRSKIEGKVGPFDRCSILHWFVASGTRACKFCMLLA